MASDRRENVPVNAQNRQLFAHNKRDDARNRTDRSAEQAEPIFGGRDPKLTIRPTELIKYERLKNEC